MTGLKRNYYYAMEFKVEIYGDASAKGEPKLMLYDDEPGPRERVELESVEDLSLQIQAMVRSKLERRLREAQEDIDERSHHADVLQGEIGKMQKLRDGVTLER